MTHDANTNNNLLYVVRSNSVGCSLSVQALEIYCRKEMSNMKLVKKIFIFAGIVNTGFYVTTGMMPILYATFGFPDPETWILPLPAEFVASCPLAILFLTQFFKE